MARLLHITDIHFGCEDQAALEAATQFALADPPDLIVVTGDITLDGRPREFEAAARWLERLPKPWIVTPGNHDTPYLNIPLRAFIPFRRYRRWIGPTEGQHYVTDEVNLRAINTARGGQPRFDWSKGAINLELADKAAQDMAAGPAGAVRIIACHHPLIDTVGAPVSGGVHRGHFAAERLAAQGIDVILTGHVHNPFADPLPFGDEKTYAVGAGTLSKRLRGVPASFNCITVEPGCIHVVAQAWGGSHFEPYRTWQLPRRERAPSVIPDGPKA